MSDYSGDDNILAGMGMGAGYDTSGNATGASGPNTQALAGAGTGLLGLGIGIASTVEGISTANAESSLSQDTAKLEYAQDQQRQQAMQISVRRQQMEITRNNQRQRSMAQTTATSQGAAFGSGLSGAYGGIAGGSGGNLLATNQNAQVGNAMFGLDASIYNNRQAMAQLQSSAATSQGWLSLGGALLKSAGSVGMLAGG